MSTEAEGKALYEGARKDLVNALMKRKEIDKQLVSYYLLIYYISSFFLMLFPVRQRSNPRFTPLRGTISQRQPTLEGTLFKALKVT
jgi:hypothetical protein